MNLRIANWEGKSWNLILMPLRVIPGILDCIEKRTEEVGEMNYEDEI
ncbi:MAG: hypothetical protein AAGF96_01640 [Bacteroidota bacterium]